MAKVIVLARESPVSYYLLNRLSENNHIAKVIFERTTLRTNLAILKRRRRRLGLRRVIDQILLILFLNLIESNIEKRKLRDIFNDQPFNHTTKDIDVIKVENINSIEVRSLICELKPDLIILSGTSLLSREFVAQFANKILNIHVGITPEYRGAHGGFWALYYGKPEKVGVTVHLIDSGIDTGPILFQEVVSVDNTDTLRTIVYKQQRRGVELVLHTIDAFKRGELKGNYKHDSTSNLYYSPGLTHYLKFKYKMKFK